MSLGALSHCTSLLSTASFTIPIGLQLLTTASLALKAVMPAIQSIEHLEAIQRGLQYRNHPIKKNYLKVQSENGQDLIIVEDIKAKTTLLVMQFISDLAKLKK
ncbi:MAG: hypothetical protein ACOYT8_06525 [Candidatus Dependentiae bacterium]